MPDADDYLALLNPEQKAAVIQEGAPLLILAGAGSGKTRVITTKIAYLISRKQVQPYSILAVTFTKKAAKEMQDRAVALEPLAANAQIRTFHSFGSWFLRKYAEEAGIDKNFTVYDDDDMATLVSKAVPSLSRQEAAKAAHRIALAKDFCLTPDSKNLVDIESSPDFPEIYSAYEKRLRSTGNVDFGDLILLPVLVLNDREQIRMQMHYRFRVILVDEYQDSNVAQFKLLQALSGAEENAGVYVCVVGDDDQSIYRFRGAEVQNILTFQQNFPGTELIRLERNYRSTGCILAAADRIVSNNENRLGKTLRAERGNGNPPVLVFLPAQDDEAAFCAELILKAYKKGCPYHDWAILYRTNAQSLEFETEFLHRKIPYTVVGSLKFYEREEIKDVLAFLALIANPRDEIAFRRIVNKPAHGIGEKTQDTVVEYTKDHAGTDGEGELPSGLIAACRECAKSMSKKAQRGLTDFVSVIDDLTVYFDSAAAGKLSVFIEKTAERSGLLEYHSSQDEISGTQRAANIQELINSAVLYPCTRQGLTDFLDAIELDREIEIPGKEHDADTVTLITIHNTKGLEFSRVIITGLENGIFPRQDKTGSDLEEERRLFYVGITRAKDELYITSCSVRRLYGRTEYMQPSQFLLEAGKDVFRILGTPPSVYGTDTFPAALHGGEPRETAGDSLSAVWCSGTRLYHDDWGYGQIIKTGYRSGEYVITVQFENGTSRQFMPQYQAHSLMIIHE